MIDTNSRISQNSLQNTSTVQSRIANVSESVAATTQQTAPSTQISSLSQQLSEAQTRGDIRDSSLDRDALAAKASNIRSQFHGSAYQQNKASYDAEVPNTNSSEHIERAKQATAYLNGGGSNPFKGLAPDQLSLIVYDEGGTFTMNEKRAAFAEQGEQRFAWECQVCAEINKQWHEKNGDISDALKSIMDYFDKLPPIEEAQYDSSWRKSLEDNINHFSANGSQANEASDRLTSIMSIIKNDV